MTPTKSTTRKAPQKAAKRFSEVERAAMRERARELKAEARADRDKAQGERDVLAKIAKMAGPDRALARRIHEIVKENAPHLAPKTWYGMPAYANADGKVVCFFKPAAQYKSRYATLGFEDAANLDDGAMWPTSYALKSLTPAEALRIAALVKKAAG
jgi:uncharacterized protein YdhG (YjbR/CyaY superfamily)